MKIHDDPFASADPDRTIIIPTPGGRAHAPAAFTQRPPSNDEVVSNELEQLPLDAGLNPLLSAANPLLDVVTQLRMTLQHPDPSALREQLVQGIRRFENRAREAGVAPEKIAAARYALCTLLDEAAASTPWGGSGAWASQSLLVHFFKESWGGEKFFLLLAKLAENPGANLDLLELMYVGLGLGLEGRYRVLENGRAQLERRRKELAQLIARQRGEHERDLSPRWMGASIAKSRLLSVLPVWIAVALSGALLLSVYLTFAYLLNQRSDPVFAVIHAFRANASPLVIPQKVEPESRVARFLAPEIERGLITVRDDANQTLITIRGDGLFAPGRAAIESSYQPLLGRIAEALASVPGKVVVTGHTDNIRITSARFPSNWHLSQERARSVASLLTERHLEADRLRVEGRGEAEPLEPNDSPSNRARNRRVEIALLAAHQYGSSKP